MFLVFTCDFFFLEFLFLYYYFCLFTSLKNYVIDLLSFVFLPYSIRQVIFSSLPSTFIFSLLLMLYLVEGTPRFLQRSLCLNQN